MRCAGIQVRHIHTKEYEANTLHECLHSQRRSLSPHMYPLFFAIVASLSPNCTSSTTVSLRLTWNEVPNVDLYEIQVAIAGSTFAPFLAVTAVNAADGIVGDLLPGTTYFVALRARDATSRLWTNATANAPIMCATQALQPRQLHVLPPTISPKSTSVQFDVAPKPAAGSLEVSYRLVGAPHGYPWTVTRIAGPAFLITGLAPDSSYEVKAALVLSAEEVGPSSDVTVMRTASTRWESFTVFRISENCGSACEVDYLYDHDAGDLLSDTDFITHAANSSHFNIEFNHSVITKYCVQRLVGPPASLAFADYVSCNGKDTEHYTCTCNKYSARPVFEPSTWRVQPGACSRGLYTDGPLCPCARDSHTRPLVSLIDRCIGRLDTSPCAGPDMGCNCSDASIETSAHYVGRMPVYAPFPTHVGNGTCDTVPQAKSTFLGYWYSLPSLAECAPVSPSSGVRIRDQPNRTPQSPWSRQRPDSAASDLQAHGRAGGVANGPTGSPSACSWARHAAQQVVHGQALLGLGFNVSAACDVPQLVQNRDVIELAFGSHPSRCCGC